MLLASQLRLNMVPILKAQQASLPLFHPLEFCYNKWQNLIRIGQGCPLICVAGFPPACQPMDVDVLQGQALPLHTCISVVPHMISDRLVL